MKNFILVLLFSFSFSAQIFGQLRPETSQSAHNFSGDSLLAEIKFEAVGIIATAVAIKRPTVFPNGSRIVSLCWGDSVLDEKYSYHLNTFQFSRDSLEIDSLSFSISHLDRSGKIVKRIYSFRLGEMFLEINGYTGNRLDYSETVVPTKTLLCLKEIYARLEDGKKRGVLKKNK